MLKIVSVTGRVINIDVIINTIEIDIGLYDLYIENVN